MYINLLYKFSMQKFKLFILAVVGTSLIATTLPGASSSTSSTLDNANVAMDYVFTDDGTNSTDVTDEAESNDNDAFEAFSSTDEDTQYLYLGSEEQFEQVFFLVERSIDVSASEDPEITWEYSTNNDWKTLRLNEDLADNFEDEDTYTIRFDAPSAWDDTEYEDENAYWIRGTMNGELEDGALIDQVSVLAFNLNVTVTDENGNALTTLEDDNFNLYETNDTKLYDFNNEGKGEYSFAINSEEDTSFLLVVDVENYMEYGIQINDLDVSGDSYKIQLTPQTGCLAPFTDIDFHWAQTAIKMLYCRGIIEGQDSSRFGVNDTVTRVEFLKMAMMNADVNTSKYEDRNIPFDDVDQDEWYYEYVAAAYALDAIDEDNEYNPEGDISRVEALTILVRMSGLEGDETSTRFTDVKASSWYAATVRLATDYDVVEGYPDKTFQPERKLSRAEAAVMIDNAYSAWYQN